MAGARVVDVLETLGTSTLAPWAVPAEHDTVLHDVVIHDPAVPDEAGEGDLLLAVGVAAADLTALLEAAAVRRVAAVVVRCPTAEREGLAEASHRAGVPLLALAPGVGWARLTSQLRSLLSTSGSPLDGDPSERPRRDLVSVANTLAAAVGGSVMVFSPQQEVLAASRLGPGDDLVRHQAVLDQYGPPAYRERLRELGVYRELWGGDDVVDVAPVPAMGARRRQAVAIRAGDEILGSIWVAEGDRPLASDSAETLRDASRAAAGHLVWLHAQSQPQRRFAEGLVLQLLSGDADVAAVASWLGVDPAGCVAVAVCAVPDEPQARRLADLLTVHFSAHRVRAVPVVSRGRVDLALCDLPADVEPSGLRDLVVRAADALRRPVLAAVGPVHPGLVGLAESRAQADAVLRVLRRDGADHTRVALLDDVRGRVQATQLCDLVAAHPDLAEGPVARLREWDAAHGATLGQSLAAYLDAFGNVNAAARGLHVHPNTVRYRVRRATEVSGLDLDDPDQRLVATVLLRAEALSEGPPGAADPAR